MIIDDVKVKLSNFEGPLDLLLHLIRKKKLDILEISLLVIADQYIEYIEQSEKLNLDLASEYLLIAAQLVNIKSKHMLKTELFLEKNDDYENSKDILLQRLIKYEKYKALSVELENKYNEAPRYEKLDDDFVAYLEDDSESVVNLLVKGSKDLENAMSNVIERIRDKKPLEVKLHFKRISIENRRKELEEIIKSEQTTSFFNLIDRPDKYYIAITFLCLLELSLSDKIILVQKSDFSDIEIRRKNEN